MISQIAQDIEREREREREGERERERERGSALPFSGTAVPVVETKLTKKSFFIRNFGERGNLI